MAEALFVFLFFSVALVLVIAVPIAAMYNSFIRLRNHCREAWSNIDTELKRRYDLIPNLVETVKGYARHERDILEKVTQLRARALASTGSPQSQARDENELIHGLRTLLAVVERYPQLKADQHFLELQRELVRTEDRIQAARRFYNANVRDLNNKVQSFPSNIIAQMFGFTEQEYFEVEALVQTVPKVNV